MGSFKIGKVVLKSLFKKPATLMYPVVPREFQERTRGHVEMDIDSCILCGICSKRCPAGAITVDRAAKKWSIERMSCVQCSACVDSCPKKSLSMANKYFEPGTAKVVDTFDIPVKEKPAAPAASASAPAAASGEDGLKNNTELCIYCGLCAKNCPSEALTVVRAEKQWSVDKDACVQCGLCVDKCPKKCLSL